MSVSREDWSWWSAAEVVAHLAVLAEWMLFPPLLDAQEMAEELAQLVYADADPERIAGLMAELSRRLCRIEVELSDMAAAFEQMRDAGFEMPQDPQRMVGLARLALRELRDSRLGRAA